MHPLLSALLGLTQLCHFLGVSFTAYGGEGCSVFAKGKTPGDADCDAGRLQALVDPVLAVVAFDHFSGFRIPLGRSPRTG